MTKRAMALAAAALLSHAAAQTAPSPEQISTRLTANGLKADVSFLASDALQGRGTPSPGLDIAAEYIAAQFRRAGLEPAGDDGYFQTAAYVNVTPNPDQLELSLDAAGKTVKVDKASMGLLEAAPADLNGVPVVKANLDEASLNALTPEQVSGKVLVFAPAQAGGFQVVRRLPALAAKLKPALVVLLRTGGQGVSATPRLREGSAAASVPILVVWDGNVRSALDAAAAGPIDAKVSAHVAAPTVAPVKLRNVIGVLRGSDPALKDTYVIVTAHYDHLGVRGTGPGDHIYNGANDDASGTASVIEIANTLAATSARPKRSVVFIALFGEELGLVGSRYYAQHPVFPLAKTVADINLEQMGRTDDVTGPRVGMVNVTGYDFTSVTGILKKAGEDFGIQVAKDEKNSDPFFAQSDNQAFADAGVPAHTLSVGYVFPDYHKPGDEWQKIDYENMAKVDRAVALAIFRVADSADAPQWNTANAKTGRYLKAREMSLHPAGSK